MSLGPYINSCGFSPRMRPVPSPAAPGAESPPLPSRPPLPPHHFPSFSPLPGPCLQLSTYGPEKLRKRVFDFAPVPGPRLLAPFPARFASRSERQGKAAAFPCAPSRRLSVHRKDNQDHRDHIFSAVPRLSRRLPVHRSISDAWPSHHQYPLSASPRHPSPHALAAAARLGRRDPVRLPGSVTQS